MGVIEVKEDVTLDCRNCQEMGANKVILGTSNSLFQNVFKRSKHPHSLILLEMKGQMVFVFQTLRHSTEIHEKKVT